jgi:hypothetical protein
VVPPPFLLAAVQRCAAADRDERVLESAPPLVVRVDVPGGDRGDPEVAGELAEGGVPPGVAALVRALKLDEEALSAERGSHTCGRIGISHPQSVSGTTGQADQPFAVLEQPVERELGRQRIRAFLRPGSCVRLGEQAAEVGVPPWRLDEQRDMGPSFQADLGAGDRPDAERLRRVRELERPADAVVVGERQGVVAEIGGTGGELLGLRSTVEERVR